MKKYELECLSTQKYTEMGAAESSEKLVYQYQTTRRHSPENSYILSHVQWSDVMEVKFGCKQLKGEDRSILSLKTIGNPRHIRTSKPMTSSWAGRLLSMAYDEFVLRLDRKT
jgi:hypothetical protein